MTPIQRYDQQQERASRKLVIQRALRALVSLASTWPHIDTEQMTALQDGIQVLLQPPPEPEYIAPPAPNESDQFVEHLENRSIRIWDWPSMTRGLTQVVRSGIDATLELYHYNERLTGLSGEPAERFWRWYIEATGAGEHLELEAN
jgi:hypothetical protein